jgi:shikimate dehydrogenase
MHNAAFKYLGINAEYRLFEVKPEELEVFLLKPDVVFKDANGNSIRAGDVLGFNITIPHKVKAREILEREFPFDKNATWMNKYLYYVKISGAINTVKRTGSRSEYYNTDAEGFINSLDKDLGFKTKNKNVLIIGCGGAGRAIIASLSWWKDVGIKKIYINDISEEAMLSAKKHFLQLPQPEYLEKKLQFISSEDIPKVITNCHLLINATPVGMKDSDSPVIDRNLFHSGLSVYDVVYNRETQLVKDAKSKERPAKGGEGMFLWQGVLAFEIWTGKTAPVEVMRQAIEQELTKSRDVS